jgi:hypothetical protein
VIEVSYSSTHPLPNPGRWRSDTIKGQAVYVDLGRGKNLFVTLTSAGSGRSHKIPARNTVPPFPDQPLKEEFLAKADGAFNAQWLPVKIFNLGRAPGQEREMNSRIAGFRRAAPQPISINNLPTAITFRNMLDPSTVELVEPNNASASLGAGYGPIKAEIALTNDSASYTIRDVLPWLSEHPELGLVPLPNDSLPEIQRVLRHGDFGLGNMHPFSF